MADNNALVLSDNENGTQMDLRNSALDEKHRMVVDRMMSELEHH